MGEPRKNKLDPWQYGWSGPTNSTISKFEGHPVPVFWTWDMPKSDVLLDHKLGLILPRSKVEEFQHILHALHANAVGMMQVFTHMINLEGAASKAIEESGESKELKAVTKMREGPAPTVASVFHWYSVVACAYVRGVGRIAQQAGLLTKNPTRRGQASEQYEWDTIPAIRSYRDKVGAHPVCFSQNEKDSDFDRIVSATAGWVILSDGNFWVPAFAVGDSSSAVPGSVKDSGLVPWSVVRAHCALYERYWRLPDQEDGHIYMIPFSREAAHVGMFIPGISDPLKSSGFGGGFFDCGGVRYTLHGVPEWVGGVPRDPT